MPQLLHTHFVFVILFNGTKKIALDCGHVKNEGCGQSQEQHF